MSYPGAVVVDGTTLYWLSGGIGNIATSGAVRRRTLADPALVTMADGIKFGTLRDLYVDATHAYWTTVDGTITRAPKDATDKVVEVIASGLIGPDGITGDDTAIYVAIREGGQIIKIAK